MISDTPLDLFAFRRGMEISRTDPPFAALIVAALHKADGRNAAVIRAAFPSIAEEAQARYDAPGDLLPGDPGYEEVQAVRRRMLPNEED